LGKNILRSGYDLEIYLHRGAAAYICGEETGLIESLEGKRAWPRIKPPFPAVEGVFRKPTVVNNVETVACVKHIADRGVNWFKSLGTPSDPKNPRDPGSYGPKLYCLSGHVQRPGCYEAPLGIPVQQLVEECGGGIWKNRRAKAAIPGGISMGLLTTAEFDCPLDFSGPGKYGCMGLGTAAVVVMDETVSMVEVLHNSCRFFAHESCGQCTPCREGTAWSVRLLERIRAGKGRLKDLELLLEIGDTIGMMPGTTICGLADGAAWPIKNAIRKFRDEFEDYVRRTNPTGFGETRAVPALAGRP
jgi:NADH-quinone oxidoreductase subunit F